MTYKLTIDQKPAYLHIIVTGQNTAENVARYMKDVLRECIIRNCRRLLIEERLEGKRLGTLDVFQIVSQGTMRSEGKISAMAYVDVNTEGKLMQFAETVAVNRGFPVKVFATVRDAESWLLLTSREGTEPHAPVDTSMPRL